jgi:predicted PhzF superfamily epimerase YddE/YHI9
MNLPLYQVDAFASALFRGNPAAVCPLDEWLPDAVMQAIAAENNLSETAFFVGSSGEYQLRWFTPRIEVELCGHATLASAYVIFNHLEPTRAALNFDTRSGILKAHRDKDAVILDFPAKAACLCEPPADLLAAVGRQPRVILAKDDTFILVYGHADEVSSLRPDSAALKSAGYYVIATAPGQDVDFVSRFFAAPAGIPEDPVTGSAHCLLAPYWSQILGCDMLKARQLSERGGELTCLLQRDRVLISGQCVLYLQGMIHLPAIAC